MTDMEPKQKKRIGTGLFQVILVVVVLSLIWFSFGQNVLTSQVRGAIPEKFGDMERVSQVEGSEALRQVSQLHNTDINLVEAYIATYAHNNDKVTVWVGKAENSGAAAELVRRMADSLAQGNAVFSNLRPITVTQNYHTHEVFQVDGPGGQHFFYISKGQDKIIVWLTVESSKPMALLEEAINTF